MKRFIVNFKKITYGFATIKAKNRKEAQKRLERADFDYESYDATGIGSDYQFEELKEDK